MPRITFDTEKLPPALTAKILALVVECDEALRGPPTAADVRTTVGPIPVPAGRTPPDGPGRPRTAPDARGRPGLAPEPEPAREARSRPPAAPTTTTTTTRPARSRRPEPPPRFEGEPPRTGKALFGWAKDHDEFDRVSNMGADRGYPRKIVDWSRPQVADVVRELAIQADRPTHWGSAPAVAQGSEVPR